LAALVFSTKKELALYNLSVSSMRSNLLSCIWEQRCLLGKEKEVVLTGRA